jgi:murein DD-endopeptidase MepM/ murein hydrolase activator NlpD
MNYVLAADVVQSYNQGTLTNPTGGGIRNDSAGEGHYGADRGDRPHLGLDLTTTNGQNIVSPVDGTAVNFTGAKTGYPIVDITPSDASLGIDKIRILYVNAPGGAQLGTSYNISAGQTIGSAANLQSLGYSNGVTPHAHVQVYVGGRPVDPAPYFGL